MTHNSRHYGRAAAALISRHPILFLKSQARWLPELLVGTGAAGVSLALGLDAPLHPGRRAVGALVSAAAALHLVLLYAGAAWGLWQLRDRPTGRLAVALLAGLVLYFVILSTGPQAYSRFRVPFTPLLAICAGCGLARRAPQAAASDPSSSQ